MTVTESGSIVFVDKDLAHQQNTEHGLKEWIDFHHIRTINIFY